MSNVFDFANAPQIEALIEKLGSIEECNRLGFADSREDGVWHLTVSGLGYLLYLAGFDGKSSPVAAEAFAAGYECAMEETHE